MSVLTKLEAGRTIMRVTAEAKEATRLKILQAAKDLFGSADYESTTTRDIARQAEIATGTLFNYFPTKEDIVMTLVVDAVSSLEHETHATIEESLFANIAMTLRQLRPFRKYLAPVLETSLSPLVHTKTSDIGDRFRASHLERVVTIAREHKLETVLGPIALQMYWTLYLGVLSYWTRDTSPKQEETLALIDQSIEMFVGWLKASDHASK